MKSYWVHTMDFIESETPDCRQEKCFKAADLVAKINSMKKQNFYDDTKETRADNISFNAAIRKVVDLIKGKDGTVTLSEIEKQFKIDLGGEE